MANLVNNTVSVATANANAGVVVEVKNLVSTSFKVIWDTTKVVIYATKDVADAISGLLPEISQMISGFVGEITNLIKEISSFIKNNYKGTKAFIKEFKDQTLTGLKMDPNKDPEELGKEMAQALFK